MKRILLMLLAVSAFALAGNAALAHGPHRGFGPPCHGPHGFYGYYGPPVVAYPRVYVAPAPVVVAPPPPVVVQPYYYAPPAASFHYYGRNFGLSLGF